MLATILLWAWFVIPALVILWAVAEESLAMAALLTLITLAVWWFFELFQIGSVWANFGTFALWTVVYLIVGAILGGGDFWLKCKDALKDFQTNSEKKARERWVTEQTKGWNDYKEFTHREYGVPLWASQHKALISTWVFFWPWQLVARLLGDYVARAVRALIRWVANLFQHISDHVFKDLQP